MTSIQVKLLCLANQVNKTSAKTRGREVKNVCNCFGPQRMCESVFSFLSFSNRITQRNEKQKKKTLKNNHNNKVLIYYKPVLARWIDGIFFSLFFVGCYTFKWNFFLKHMMARQHKKSFFLFYFHAIYSPFATVYLAFSLSHSLSVSCCLKSLWWCKMVAMVLITDDVLRNWTLNTVH